VNERIRVPEIRLIGAEGQQVGVVKTFDALRMAKEQELDLVLISPQTVPPVARILDFGKFKYEQTKHDKGTKKSKSSSGIKEVKLTVKIGEHDFLVRVTKAREFLEKKQRVKVSLYFKGREVTHREFGDRVLSRFLEAVIDLGKQESPIKLEGRNLVLQLVPK